MVLQFGAGAIYRFYRGELRKLFGRGFVEQVVALEPDEWHGPILSGFGTHLVLVGDVHTAEPPDLKEVKEQATEAWINQRTDELAEGFIDNLVSRYQVTVETTEVPLTASTPEQAQ